MEAKYKEKKADVPEERELTSTYTSHKYSKEKELLKETSYKNAENLEKNQTHETSSKGKRVFLKKS